MSAKTQRLITLVTADDENMVKQLAQRLDVSQAEIVRRAIRASHAMLVMGKPTCATGAPCMIPHMHVQAAPAQQYVAPQPSPVSGRLPLDPTGT